MEKKTDYYFIGGYSSFIFDQRKALLIFPKDAA
jgi:hypothetical protein